MLDLVESGDELRAQLLDRLADDLYYLGGLERLTITGGEPLVRKGLLPFIERRPLSTLNDTFADLKAHRTTRRVVLIPE